MTLQTNFTKEQIIDSAIRLMYNKSNRDVSLKELSEATGIVALVFYNYFNGIDDINDLAYKKIQNGILEAINVKLPASMPPYEKTLTVVYNLIKYLEQTGLSTIILLEKENRKIDNKPLLNKLEDLFSGMKGLKYDTVLSVGILLHVLAANIEYSRTSGKSLPDDFAENVFKTYLFN